MPQFRKYYFSLLLAGALSNLACLRCLFSFSIRAKRSEADIGLRRRRCIWDLSGLHNQSVHHDFSQLPNAFIFNFLFYDM